MGITRDLGRYVEPTLITEVRGCTTGVFTLQGSNASTNGTIFYTQIIDRLDPNYQSMYQTAEVYVTAQRTCNVGSTEADQKITLLAKLQHDASSCGSAMADVSTGQTPASRVYFTSALTTPMACWSTGPIRATHQAFYNLQGSERYIRGGVSLTIPSGTTDCTSGGTYLVHGGIRLGASDSYPIATAAGVGSTATAT
jgi:hypothetical protein